MRPLLEWHELGVRLRGEESMPPIVSGLNLELQRGECVALTGRSGCGKTSAALAAFGLLPAQLELTGVARFAGNPAGNPIAQSVGERVAFVLQEPASNFAPHLNIQSQIIDLNGNIGVLDIHQWCTELGLVDSERLLRQYPNQCSGGELQRLALVAALAQEPALLVADEPTAALDSASRDAWCRLVRQRCEHGLAVLLVTHDPAVLAGVAHRQIPVGDAQVTEAPPPYVAPERLIADPNLLLSVQMEYPGGAPSATGGEGFGLQLGVGQALCVTGPSGAGKSSLLRLVLGLPSPWRGEVTWRGLRLQPWPHASRQQMAGAMGAVLQEARGSLNTHREVLDGVSAGFRRSGHTWRVSRQRAAEELAVLGVPADCWSRSPSALSVGQAQRVALAQALAQPRVQTRVQTRAQASAGSLALLVLDEPTSAQDLAHRQRVADRLLVAQYQHGTALLIASHDPGLVRLLGCTTLPLFPVGAAPKG